MPAMKHWLMKSEPDEFSIDALERVVTEPWTGVRNYQARNYMLKDMKVGDPILFYHSNCAVPGVVGLAEVASAPYPDPTQFDRKSDYHDPKSSREEPRWWLVDVRFVRKFRRTVSLEDLKARADEFGDFALLRRGNRLSVLPVGASQFKRILSME
ncbi:MAG: EVE domain-containing protein [Arenimonas sp. SCN 70-307]|uniref:EVE domain-containing protein n=1 Tax=Arenimonas sp. SCN 70-307 TaxID=1660089 RepID=UPI00086FA561|nr:EVE domain-containing protein [Arenimonas sp. SCN 70-307]ODS63156.1 MAG: EVE domain-containing protein [Arenimonas sp. SCN 70-307]